MTVTLERLLAVVRDVHGQHADDLCWLDIDRIFLAAGLPVPDRRVGCKQAMLANCERFLEVMCRGGHWPSYADLEAERDRLLAANGKLAAELAELEALRTQLERRLAKILQAAGNYLHGGGSRWALDEAWRQTQTG